MSAEHDLVCLGVDSGDVERPRGVARQSQAAPLADGEELDAGVRSQYLAAHVHEVARSRTHTVGDELAIVVVGYEADLLAVGLVGDGKSGLVGEGADVFFAILADGKQQAAQLRLPQREQDVGLVLRGVDAL